MNQKRTKEEMTNREQNSVTKISLRCHINDAFFYGLLCCINKEKYTSKTVNIINNLNVMNVEKVIIAKLKIACFKICSIKFVNFRFAFKLMSLIIELPIIIRHGSVFSWKLVRIKTGTEII